MLRTVRAAATAAFISVTLSMQIASPATAAEATPQIFYGANMKPFDEAILSLVGFDFSRPVTLHFFGETSSFLYSPGGKLLMWSPPDTKPGTYRIWAQQGERIAERYVYVGGFYPWARPSSYYARVGDRITFDAWDFLATEQVALLRDGADTGLRARVGSNILYYETQGRLKGALPFTVPPSLRGQTVKFTLHGTYSGASTDVWITIAR